MSLSRKPARWSAGFAVCALLFFTVHSLHAKRATSVPSTTNPFVGSWTYRSFRNDPTPVGDVNTDPSKLVGLLFAEAQWVVQDSANGTFKGELRFGPNDVMDLTGTITAETATCPPRIHINGKGRPGTSTEHLFYDYDGSLVPTWPNGVDQRPAIVGSVIRVKPHDGSPAGYVASFIAVKKS
jgi:hypothetical protein